MTCMQASHFAGLLRVRPKFTICMLLPPGLTCFLGAQGVERAAKEAESPPLRQQSLPKSSNKWGFGKKDKETTQPRPRQQAPTPRAAVQLVNSDGNMYATWLYPSYLNSR